MLWTDEETRELITLWPTSSASQIASRLDRPRAAVTGKVNRLRQEGALPADVIKHYVVAPVQMRPKRDRTAWAIAGLCSDGAVPHLEMQPCSILELDDSRCHWPLGGMHEVATLFCGGVAVTDRPYCAHHLRMARSHGSVS